MIKFTDFMAEAAKCKEELHPNQKKLDKNNNGKLDSDDFKKLRASKDVDENYVSAAQRKAVWASKNEKGVKEETEYAIEDFSIEELEDFMMSEEFEQLDEISKKVLGSYVKKASSDLASSIHGERDAEENDNEGERKAMAKRAEKRMSGLEKAGKKIAKEEVEQIDELSKKTLGSYAAKASHSAANKMYSAGYTDHMSHAERNKGNDALAQAHSRHAGKSYSKSVTRLQGIERATKKLAKEEVEQIDEISKDTMKSYVTKAATDIGFRGIDAGKNSDRMDRLKAYAKMGKRVKGIEKATNKLSKEEVELDEAMTPMQKLRDALDRHSEKAIAANKRGDDVAVKTHQAYMNKIKTKMGKLAKNEQVEQIDEDMKAAAKAMHDYASVHGGMDKKDFHTAAKHMEAGNHEALHKHIKSLDSEPRDKILATLHKHGNDIKRYGYSMREETEQIDEVLSKNAPAGEWVKDFVDSDNPKFAGKSKEKRRQMALAAYYAKRRNEEVDMVSFGEFINRLEEAKSCKKEEAEIDESAIDDLKDKMAMKKADPTYHYSKSYKAGAAKKSNVTVHKGKSYGAGEEDNEDDDEKQAEPQVKRGRGRPAGSKSGSYKRR